MRNNRALRNKSSFKATKETVGQEEIHQINLENHLAEQIEENRNIHFKDFEYHDGSQIQLTEVRPSIDALNNDHVKLEFGNIQAQTGHRN